MDYIRVLSSYEDTKEEDEKKIREFLKEKNKDELSKLTNAEASDLIQKLLKRPVGYEFPCGRKEKVNKKRANRFNLFGSIESCIHACPENRDPNSCKWFQKN
ncbi:hypothetical protein AKJ61_03040 [candidate division MSBL1 archaeon SCGC-AAA259B11]|uniref:Uncharacterized protein n=1 Tax=candidate division MSBL1 archaeon SCGC-AAA259B11 TaxID=1698260 RepID=A0A133U586_9EURY|nr:hypothetical protein AKJ61_03040 [candidate division MSBL1 archaeon SCGC-AAA259B11]